MGVGWVSLPPRKAGYLGGGLDQMPTLVVHLHFNQDVAGEEFAGRFAPLALDHLHHFFHGHQYLAEVLLQAMGFHSLIESFLDLVLIPGVGVDYVPPLGHWISFLGCSTTIIFPGTLRLPSEPSGIRLRPTARAVYFTSPPPFRYRRAVITSASNPPHLLHRPGRTAPAAFSPRRSG